MPTGTAAPWAHLLCLWYQQTPGLSKGRERPDSVSVSDGDLHRTGELCHDLVSRGNHRVDDTVINILPILFCVCCEGTCMISH